MNFWRTAVERHVRAGEWDEARRRKPPLLDDEWFEQVVPLVKGRRVLLCGAVEDPPDYDRSFARRVLEAGARHLTGVDVRVNPYPELDCLVGNMEEMELGGPYDVVFVPKAFNHVGNPQRFLTNVRGVLVPGGVLVIKTPGAGSLELLLAKLLGRLDRTDYANPRHVVWHEQRSLESLLASCGYQVVQRFSVQGRRTWKQRLLWLCVKIRPELAEDLLIVCRRAGEPA